MAEIVLGLGTSHTPMLTIPAEMWETYAQGDQRIPELAYPPTGQVRSFEEGLNYVPAEIKARYQGPGPFADMWQRCQRVLDTLAIPAAHVVGWSMGGGVAMQLLLDRPELVSSLTLVSPVSPYGFGGTDAAGRVLDPEEPGVGGGGANPDFVQRLLDQDRSADAPTSPRNVLRGAYVADPATVAEHEDVWVESMLTTRTGEGNYPGDSREASAWPGFGPGARGVLNTMAPRYFDTSGIVELPVKPAIIWVHGAQDAIVSDASFFDLNQLGAAGVIPGWPGAQVAPPQPMVSQTRAVFERYAASGGVFREVELDGVGHSAHLEAPEAFRAALLGQLG